jgi:hypothetical protein
MKNVGSKKSHKRTKREVAAALRAAKGLVSFAADALDISMQSVYAWIKRHPDLKVLEDEMVERRVDAAVLRIDAEIANRESPGGIASAMFTLKCLAKNRGYIELQKIEHTGPGGGPVSIAPAVETLSDEQLESLAARGRARTGIETAGAAGNPSESGGEATSLTLHPLLEAELPDELAPPSLGSEAGPGGAG